MSMSNLDRIRNADWDAVERDVVQRIRALRKVAKSITSKDDNALCDMVAKDLIIPNVLLLGEFCQNVKISEEVEIGSPNVDPTLN